MESYISMHWSKGYRQGVKKNQDGDHNKKDEASLLFYVSYNVYKKRKRHGFYSLN